MRISGGEITFGFAGDTGFSADAFCIMAKVVWVWLVVFGVACPEGVAETLQSVSFCIRASVGD